MIFFGKPLDFGKSGDKLPTQTFVKDGVDMAATIVDIAKKVGISASWVSIVLRNHPRAKEVSPQVRERIKAAAKELHYHRNLSATTIVKGFNSSTIAMIVPEISTTGSPSYLGMRYFCDIRFFNEHGYGVRIYCGNDLEKVFQEILSNQIRYVFINHLDQVKMHFCAELCRKNSLKAAFRDWRPEAYPEFPSFGPDSRRTAAMLVEYLAELGHTRIAAAFGSFKARVNLERYNGWLDALKKCRLSSCSDMYIHVNGFSDAAFLTMLRKYQPTAIFASDSSFARRILSFCSFNRISIPQAFSVVSSDSLMGDFYLPVSVTGINGKSILENTEKSIIAYFEGKTVDSALFTGMVAPGESSAPPSGDLSWLNRLPKTLDHDREWFPNNSRYETEELGPVKKNYDGKLHCNTNNNSKRR